MCVCVCYWPVKEARAAAGVFVTVTGMVYFFFPDPDTAEGLAHTLCCVFCSSGLHLFDVTVRRGEERLHNHIGRGIPHGTPGSIFRTIFRTILKARLLRNEERGGQCHAMYCILRVYDTYARSMIRAPFRIISRRDGDASNATFFCHLPLSACWGVVKL